MAKTILGTDLLPFLDPLIEVLDQASAVQQQQALELLLMRHVSRGQWDLKTSDFVVDSFAKHVKQLIRQAKTYEELLT